MIDIVVLVLQNEMNVGVILFVYFVLEVRYQGDQDNCLLVFVVFVSMNDVVNQGIVDIVDYFVIEGFGVGDEELIFYIYEMV